MAEVRTRIFNWNPNRGFGFCEVDGRRVFVHVSAIRPQPPRGSDLNGREIRVEEIREGEKGPRVRLAVLLDSTRVIEDHLVEDDFCSLGLAEIAITFPAVWKGVGTRSSNQRMGSSAVLVAVIAHDSKGIFLATGTTRLQRSRGKRSRITRDWNSIWDKYRWMNSLGSVGPPLIVSEGGKTRFGCGYTLFVDEVDDRVYNMWFISPDGRRIEVAQGEMSDRKNDLMERAIRVKFDDQCHSVGLEGSYASYAAKAKEEKELERQARENSPQERYWALVAQLKARAAILDEAPLPEGTRLREIEISNLKDTGTCRLALAWKDRYMNSKSISVNSNIAEGEIEKSAQKIYDFLIQGGEVKDRFVHLD